MTAITDQQQPIIVTTKDSPLGDKISELCQAILDQPAFPTIRQRIDAFLVDEEAQQQFLQLNQKGEVLERKQQQGAQLTDTEIADFEQLRTAFMGNPVAQAFMEARHEMHTVQEAVSRHVTKTFELGRVPNAGDFPEGTCGSGCHCH